MCLYPRLIKNRKYTDNKKNGGNIPPVKDERTRYVPIGCGECKECRKQKAREWQIRMSEEIKENKNGKFITLTFSNESIYKLIKNTENLKACKHLKNLKGYILDNAIATVAMRLFLERWRKKYKKSVRHWMVTELGHMGTENIHLHGIIWTNESFETIKEIWNYGHIWPNTNEYKTNYVSTRTVNYIVKYVSKIDKDHKLYKPIILTSAGIGRHYTKTQNFKDNKYNENQTRETYRTSTGHKISLPIYYRNKIYTEEQREQLWIQKLDRAERWVGGERISVENGHEEYEATLKWHQNKNKELGYGDGIKTEEQWWNELELREIQYAKRLAQAKKTMDAARRPKKVPLRGTKNE